ncbi:opsin, ultraviolet-sensitive-like isoform X2 [Pomacea canaliculata]|nr:opsin, ultraviolet-sensitive-like isoform X2 [Pomacea canaliculata]
MKSKPLRHKSYSHYLCALAVFDSLTLVTREMRHLHDLLTYFQYSGVFSDFSAVGCKIFSFSECVSCLMSSWLVVAMALERVLVVYVPFRKNVWCTQRGAVAIIISLFVIFSYSQVFRFVMVTKTEGQCEGHRDYLAAYLVLHVYVYQLCLAYTLPIIIVFAANISVLRKICQVERTFRQDENSASTRLTHASSGRSKTTRMLLTICFVYVLTLLPGSTLSIVMIVAYQLFDLATSQQLLVAAVPWYNVLIVVSDLNYALNFYIYVLSGKKFRLELRRIFRTDRFVVSSHSTRTREEFILS